MKSTDDFGFKSYGTFASFPLPLLGFPASWKDIVGLLRRFSIMRAAKAIHERKDPMKLRYPDKAPKDFNPKNNEHRAIGAAMLRMNLQGGSIKRIKGGYEAANAFLDEHGLHKGQAPVTISLTLLNESRLTERDKRVLAAVNSCCGKKQWNIINWRMISWRAVGAMDQPTLERLGVEPLTRRQVQLALSKLERKRLIRRIVVNRRKTFVCVSAMQLEKLQGIVVDWCKRRSILGKAMSATSGKNSVTFANGNTVSWADQDDEDTAKDLWESSTHSLQEENSRTEIIRLPAEQSRRIRGNGYAAGKNRKSAIRVTEVGDDGE